MFSCKDMEDKSGIYKLSSKLGLQDVRLATYILFVCFYI